MRIPVLFFIWALLAFVVGVPWIYILVAAAFTLWVWLDE